MFDIGGFELLVIATVLIVVVGPKDLPPMLRAFGRTMSKVRAMAADFRSQFDDALREAELDEVRKTVADVRGLDPRRAIREEMEPLRKAGNDVRDAINRDVDSDDRHDLDEPVEMSETERKVAERADALDDAGGDAGKEPAETREAGP